MLGHEKGSLGRIAQPSHLAGLLRSTVDSAHDTHFINVAQRAIVKFSEDETRAFPSRQRDNAMRSVNLKCRCLTHEMISVPCIAIYSCNDTNGPGGRPVVYSMQIR